MRRLSLIGALVVVLLSFTHSYGQTQQRLQGYCEKGGEVVVTDGRSSTTRVQRSYPSCTITVYVNGTLTPATIYSDYSSTPLANPFTADTSGYWSFVVDSGRYDVKMSGSGFTSPVTRSGLWVASGGGGGGGSVGPGTIDRIPRFDTTTTIADSVLGQIGTSEVKFAATGKRVNLDTGSQVVVEFTNNTGTGTVDGRLARLTGAPSTATVATTSTTSGLIGVVVSNGGTTGAAQVVVSGVVPCQFDGSTTAGNYVGASTTLAGRCTDLGATLPDTGVQIIGRVLSTNVGAGTYSLYVFTGEQKPAQTAFAGTTNYVALWTTATTVGTAPNFFRDATTDPGNPEYVLQENLQIYTTRPSSKLTFDIDQIVLSGAATRTNATNMVTLKATATQSGDFFRATNSGGTPLFRIRSTGQPMFGGLNFTFPGAYAVTTPECMQMSSLGVISLTGSACGSGGSSLIDTYIGYGSAANALTGTSTFTWNNTTRTQTLTAASTAFIDMVTGSTASAIRMPAGAAPASHPGSGGGIIFPNVGGDQTQGPGVWWCSGAYNSCSGLYLNLGLTFQGYGTGGSPFKVRKGTGTSATGDLIFELRPDDGQINLYPHAAGVGGGTTVNFFELAANGTSRVELQGPESLAATIAITLPNALPGSTQCLQMSNTGVISTSGGACGAAGSTPWSSLTLPSGNLSLAMALNTTIFTWAGNSATSELFTMRDTTGNTGTGTILLVQSRGTSTINPFAVETQEQTALIVNGDVAPATRVDMWSRDVGTVPLRLIQETSQTADSFHVVDSSGTVLMSVGAEGSLNKIRQVAYSWPAAQGAASTILTNDGSGNLTWSAAASGSLPQATLQSANYAALTSDWLVSMDATAGVRTITLYAASGNSGRIIQTCKRDASVNQVNVTDGSTTWNIFTSGTCIQFMSDGSAWQVQSY